MMLHFPDGMRKKVLPNTTKWFENIMNTPEAIKAYGKTVLCKVPVKPSMEKIKNKEKEKEHQNKSNKSNEKKETKKEKEGKKDEEKGEEKPTKKEKNPLDLLPPSKFNLEDFKRSFLNSKNKQEAIKKFWDDFDPEGYSLWWLEYQNLPEEGKVLFRTSNAKSFFLQKLDSFRRYCFAVHGVYGKEGDYKIRGVWMWRGKDIPNEIKENDYYDFLTIRSLDPKDKDDVELINDFWTKLNETDKVQGRFAVDCSYFN
jgi:elongation factor 1-gamma